MNSHFAGWPHGGFGRLEPGSRIAGYLIEERVGEGGMSVVFRARDETLGRLVAVKVIRPAMASDPEFRVRFLRESRAAASVESPYIVPVYGAGEHEGLLYIATRFVAGGDLAALLSRAGGRLTLARTVRLTAQVASALDAAHAVGLVHRDVKPHNILVDAGPERAEHAYLCDFGLSKATLSPAKLTMTGQFVGTPLYSSPEQIRAMNVDGRTDQYALATVVFALLTGKLPFDRGEPMATLFAQVHDPVPAVTQLRPELPAAIDDVLARALAKSSADRYASCGAFTDALLTAVVPVLPTRFTLPAEGPRHRKPEAGDEESREALRRTDELRRLIDANHRAFADGESPVHRHRPTGERATGEGATGERADGAPALSVPPPVPDLPGQPVPADSNVQPKRRRRWSPFPRD